MLDFCPFCAMDGVTITHDICARRELMWRQIDALLADDAKFRRQPFSRDGRPDVTWPSG